MPIDEDFTAQVDLPGAFDWELLAKIERFLRDQWGPATTTYLDVRDSCGSFKADSLLEAQEAIVKRSSQLERLQALVRLGPLYGLYSGYFDLDDWRQKIIFHSSHESTARGVAAALERRLEQGFPEIQAGGLQSTDGDQEKEGSWWKSHWVQTVAAGVIATVIGGLVLAWIL